MQKDGMVEEEKKSPWALSTTHVGKN